MGLQHETLAELYNLYYQLSVVPPTPVPKAFGVSGYQSPDRRKYVRVAGEEPRRDSGQAQCNGGKEYFISIKSLLLAVRYVVPHTK